MPSFLPFKGNSQSPKYREGSFLGVFGEVEKDRILRSEFTRSRSGRGIVTVARSPMSREALPQTACVDWRRI